MAAITDSGLLRARRAVPSGMRVESKERDARIRDASVCIGQGAYDSFEAEYIVETEGCQPAPLPPSVRPSPAPGRGCVRAGVASVDSAKVSGFVGCFMRGHRI